MAGMYPRAPDIKVFCFFSSEKKDFRFGCLVDIVINLPESDRAVSEGAHLKINFSPPALKAIEAAPAGTRISATTPNGICLHGVKASNTLLASPILGTGLPGAQLTHQDAGEPSDDCTEELKTIILAIADCFDVSVPPDPASACLKVMAKIEHFSPDRAIGDGLAIGLDVEELIANCGELARPVKICFNVVRVGCALWGIKTKSSARALGRHDGASV